MAKVTIKEIAKESGVSVTAVSFVLNGKASSVSKETAEKVLSVCQKYNYKPNYFASALKTKTTHTVGVLIPDIENGYYSRIIKSLESNLTPKGYSLIISSSGYDSENFMKNIADIANKQIDFFVIVPPSNIKGDAITEEKLNSLVTSPIIILDRKIEGVNAPLVINDDKKGGYIATDYLIKKGHKCIACITGPKNVSSSNDRLSGYKQALKDNGISFDNNLIFEGNYQFDGALESAKKVLSNDKVTAVFAFNDLMAYAVYKVANEMNKVIGKDVSIIGFDDNQFSSLITPSLTTIKQNIDLICNSVVEMMLSKEITNGKIVVEPGLVERSSVNAII